MKTLLLYRPNSEHERMVIDYLRDFRMQTGKELPTLDIDTKEGIETSRLYGIMRYPAILAADNEGHVLNLWVGEPLPRISEVSYYVDTTIGQEKRVHESKTLHPVKKDKK